ncbi:MAG: TIGR04255 family protein [Candidatus Nanopelagicales bacterium]
MTDLPTAVDEYDVPLGGLISSQRLAFNRTHLEAVVAEVRFVASREEVTEAEAVAVWKQVGADLLPVFERTSLNTLTVTVTPGGADQHTVQQQGWVMASADRATSVTVFPAMLVVQTARYERYSRSLAGPLAAALRAYAEAMAPSVVQRIGLRYINRLTDAAATTPEFWRDHVQPAFAGTLRSDLAAMTVGLHQQAHLRLDDFAAARVQTGVFQEPNPEGRFSYLLDIDVFREQAMPFDLELCGNLTRQLNRTALALFLRVLSERYVADLEPVVEGDPR